MKVGTDDSFWGYSLKINNGRYPLWYCPLAWFNILWNASLVCLFTQRHQTFKHAPACLLTINICIILINIFLHHDDLGDWRNGRILCAPCVKNNGSRILDPLFFRRFL
jgi:hypothetical protein